MLLAAPAGCSLPESHLLPACHTPSMTAPTPGFGEIHFMNGNVRETLIVIATLKNENIAVELRMSCMTHSSDSGQLSAGAEQAVLQ